MRGVAQEKARVVASGERANRFPPRALIMTANKGGRSTILSSAAFMAASVTRHLICLLVIVIAAVYLRCHLRSSSSADRHDRYDYLLALLLINFAISLSLPC